MVRKVFKRTLSNFLAISMIVTTAGVALPSGSQQVQAAVSEESQEMSTAATEEDSSQSEKDVFSSLGLNKDASPDDISGSPYGKDVFTANVINELDINTHLSEGSGSERIIDNIRFIGSSNTVSTSDKFGGDDFFSVDNASSQEYYRTEEAVCFDGSGKKNSVALLTINDSEGMVLKTYKVEKNGKKGDSATTKVVEASSSTELFNHISALKSVDKLSEYTALFEMTAGDYDGDSCDEVAVYVPADNKCLVKIYKFNGLGSSLKCIKTIEVPHSIPNSNTDENLYAIVSMTSGDLDKDGKEELVIVNNEPYASPFTYSNKGSVTIYDVEDTTKVYKDRKLLDFDTAGGLVRYAGAAIGNIDTGMESDNNDVELVVAGYKGENKPNTKVTREKLKYIILKYGRDSQDKETLTTVKDFTEVDAPDIDKIEQLYDDSKQYIPPLVVACAATGGAEYQEHVFMAGGVYQYSVTEGLAQVDSVNGKGQICFMDGSKYGYDAVTMVYIDNVIAGNFDGNPMGKEQFIYSLVIKQSKINKFSFDVGYMQNNGSGETYKYSASQMTVVEKKASKNKDGRLQNGSSVAIAAVDVDEDSTIMRYKGKTLSYTNPEVLTILQSAPYFQDIADENSSYLDNSSTALGNTKGSSSSFTAGASFYAGGYVSYSNDVSFLGFKIVGFETEWQASVGFDYSHEENWEMSTSVQYSGSAGNDYAVIFSVPYINYRYDAWIPEKVIPGNVSKGTYQSDYTSTNKAYYDFINEYMPGIYNSEKNGSKLWKNMSSTEQGEARKQAWESGVRPGATTGGYWDEVVVNIPLEATNSVVTVDQYDEIARTSGTLEPIRGNILKSEPGNPSTYMTAPGNGTFSKIGKSQQVRAAGGSNITVTRETTDSVSNSFSGSLSVDGKIGAGAAGFKSGVVVGASGSAGYGYSDFTGVAFTGTVDNLPDGYSDYSFTWQFGSADAKLNGNNVKILCYKTSNVIRPLASPKRLRTQAVSCDNVKLRWDGVNEAICYVLKTRMFDGTMIPMYYISGDKNEYTVSDLEPNTEYEFVVSAVRSNGENSKDSNPVSVSTLSKASESIKITKQPKDVVTYIGGKAVFDATAEYSNTDGSEASLYYQWQYSENGIDWKYIDGANRSKYTISSTKAADFDRQYRCLIYKNSKCVVYTDISLLTEGKLDTSIRITKPISAQRVQSSYTKVIPGPDNVEKYSNINLTGCYPVILTSTDSNKKITALKSITDADVFYAANFKYSLHDGVYVMDSSQNIGDIVKGAKFGLLANPEKVKITPIDYGWDFGLFDSQTIEKPLFKDCTNIPLINSTLFNKTLKDPLGDGQDYIYYINDIETVNVDNPLYGIMLGSTEGKTIDYTIYPCWKKGNYDEKTYIISRKITTMTDSTGWMAYTEAYEIPDTTMQVSGDSNIYDFTEFSYVKNLSYGKGEDTREFVKGDAVNLAADITTADGPALEGNVNWKIVNTTTGKEDNITSVVKNKKVAAVWSPSESGRYSITAQYYGSSLYNGAVSDDVVADASGNPADTDKMLSIMADSCMDVNDRQQLGIQFVTANGSENVTTGSVVKSVYLDGKSIEVSSVISSSKLFTPSKAGQYKITISYTSKGVSYTANRTVTVNKGVLDIMVFINTVIKGNSLSSINVNSNIANIIQPGDIMAAGNVDTSKLGDYPLDVKLTAAAEQRLSEKYVIALRSGTVSVTEKSYIYKASTEGEGKVLAYNLVNGLSIPVEDGSKILTSSKISLNAVPSKGNKFVKWVVGGKDYTVKNEEIELPVSANIDVKAVFAEIVLPTYKVSYDTVNPAYTIAVSDASVKSGGSCTFTLAVSENYIKTDEFAVKSNGKTLTPNADGIYTISNITSNQSIDIVGLQDNRAPIVDSMNDGINWMNLSDELVATIYTNQSKEIIVAANDYESGMDKVYCFVADTVKNPDEVKAYDSWQELNGSYSLEEEGQYFVYIKAVDKAGNETYRRSNRFVIDKEAPSIDGLADGMTYYTNAEFAVTDDNLEEVTVDGVRVMPVNGQYILSVKNNLQVIKATDKNGNESSISVMVAPNTVKSIMIKNQPDKLSYIDGDNLSLDGLVVRLTYDDGDTLDVGYNDFAINGITVSMFNNAILSLENNENTIEVMCNGKKVSTEKIYVRNDRALYQRLSETIDAAKLKLDDGSTYTTATLEELKAAYAVAVTLTENDSKAAITSAIQDLQDNMIALKVATANIILTSNPENSGILSGGGYYAAGDEVEVSSKAVPGYTFAGWYAAGADLNGTAETTEPSFTYTVLRGDSRISYIAKYVSNEKKKLSIDFGSGAVDYAYNTVTGTLTEPITEQQYLKGTYFTLTAKPAAERQFLYWINPVTGRILSEDARFSFYLIGNVQIEACYKSAAAAKCHVIFKDMNGQILQESDIDKGTSVDNAPEHGIFDGYEFDKWDKEFTNVTENMVITALYTKKAGFSISVLNDSGTILDAQDNYEYGTLVTVQAEEQKDGKYFSGWYLGENMVCDQRNYSFYVTHSRELEARFNGGNVLKEQPIVNMTMGNRSELTDNKQNVTMNVSWSLPSGYTLMEAGVVRTYDGTAGTEDSLKLESVDGSNVRNNASKLTNEAGTYVCTLRINNASVRDLYARGYLTYKEDSTGKITTVYSTVNTSSK